ncbi:MAG: hypothetical protein JNL79_04620 [Myxococcales bacterium]|nr:hypothetical protein [Myxococcales bacterium]
MSNLGQIIAAWTNRRIDEVLVAPRMWGSREAVEMQVLQLLEIRALALRPGPELANPRRVLDMYLQYLQQHYPEQPAEPLFSVLAQADDEAFGAVLRDFREELARATLLENPFEQSELVIRLTFDVGQHPSTSAFTGYYEEFRRTARAAVRTGVRATGRPKKDIESATDFTLEDAVVSPPNGAAGEVLLRLGAGVGQMNWEANERVRDALSTILTLGEWAGGGGALAELPLADIELRTRTAVQALRLLPRRGIRAVAWNARRACRPPRVPRQPRSALRRGHRLAGEGGGLRRGG